MQPRASRISSLALVAVAATCALVVYWRLPSVAVDPQTSQTAPRDRVLATPGNLDGARRNPALAEPLREEQLGEEQATAPTAAPDKRRQAHGPSDDVVWVEGRLELEDASADLEPPWAGGSVWVRGIGQRYDRHEYDRARVQADGSFRVALAASNAWGWIQLDEDGLGFARSATFDLADPPFVTLATMPLTSFGGRVVDDTGEPLTNVSLTYHRLVPGGSCGGHGSRGLPAEVRSGAFEIPNIEPGRLCVGARVSGNYVKSAPTTFDTSRPNEHTIVITRGATLEGRVVDYAGNPVAGAEISLEGGPRMKTWVKDVSGEVRPQRGTLEDGTFELTEVPPGNNVIVVEASPTAEWEVEISGWASIGELPEVRARVDVLGVQPAEHRTGIEILVPVRDDSTEESPPR